MADEIKTNVKKDVEQPKEKRTQHIGWDVAIRFPFALDKIGFERLCGALRCYLSDAQFIRQAFCAYHDKDMKDGEPIPAHAHVVIYFSNVHDKQFVINWFWKNCTQKFMTYLAHGKEAIHVEPIENDFGAIRYLWHADEDPTKKYIYESSDVWIIGAEYIDLFHSAVQGLPSVYTIQSLLAILDDCYYNVRKIMLRMGLVAYKANRLIIQDLIRQYHYDKEHDIKHK